MTNSNRQSRGTPIGGQFAPTRRAAAGLPLPGPAEYSPAAAEQMHEHVASLRMKSNRLKSAEICSQLSDLGITSLSISVWGEDDFEVTNVVDTNGQEVDVGDERYDRAAELAADYPVPTETGVDVDVLAGVEDLDPAFVDLHSSLAVIPGLAA